MLAVSLMTDFQPDVFARELVRLRTDAHLSQRTLARLSKVSNTAISDLEAGDAPAPHPMMLSKLARGLATSGSGAFDKRRSEEAYLALMTAAGYVPETPAQVMLIDMREALTARGFRPDEAHVVDQIIDDVTSKEMDEQARGRLLNAISDLIQLIRSTRGDR